MRRALLVFAVGCLLAACAPSIAPPGTSSTTPHLTDTSFVTADGLSLAVRRWLPEGQEPRAIILAVHGFNDYSKAFDKVPGAPGVGPYLAGRGFAVFAYDQRGFGRSPHFGLWPGGDTMVTDFGDFARVLKAMYPQVPLYGLGESMGGAVVMTALAQSNPPPLNGAVLSAPAVWARSTMPVFYRPTLWFAAHLMPAWKPTGDSLGRMASDNIDMLRDNGRDPLFIKQTRIDSVYGLSNLMDQALAASPRITAPVLYLYGHHDQIIPRKPTREALEALTTKDPQAVRPAYYPNGWHMLMRDKQAPTVLEDIASFLGDPAAPLPSRADVDALPRLNATQGPCPPCD